MSAIKHFISRKTCLCHFPRYTGSDLLYTSVRRRYPEAIDTGNKMDYEWTSR